MSHPVRRVRRALLLGIPAPAVLFLLITWQVVGHGPLLRADARLSRDLVQPDGFAQFLSDLGDVQVAVPVLLVAAGYALWRGRGAGHARWWLPPLAAAVLMALLPALVVPLKDWIARPGTPVVPPATGYFPSGHTATAAVAYGSATLLLLPWLRTRTARRSVLALCAVLVLGVSYGLVRHGYHWPLDVVGSWCLSAALLTALGALPGFSRSSRRTSSGTPSSSSGPS
ncbi:phosphatase PAP2 family protein [Streptomyces murinus]|uniref:phosphatase PAP2 family protein n=1 Tax=Streptomyces murinus TaxID=33900 RepID=UPI001FC9D107|nr:phosphatase PAP2 family protein [Streptomyces murinus]